MLSDKDIEKFQEIYKDEFGSVISRQEALEQGTKLVNLMKILLENNTENSAKTKKRLK